MVYILLGTFSLATPLGVLIGMCISGGGIMTHIIFNSFAGGTFLYISASEVIVEEFSVNIKKWTKLIAFIMGALFITFLTMISD